MANIVVACCAACVLMAQNLQHGPRVRAHLVTFYSEKLVIYSRTCKRPNAVFQPKLWRGMTEKRREESLHKKPTSAFTHF
jgi:hypothetical protein